VNALVLANFPLAILVILAIVGIPLWMTFKRPETAPDYAEARAHFGAKAGLRAVPAYATARSHADRATQPTRVAA
jgi:hypothetical protein